MFMISKPGVTCQMYFERNYLTYVEYI